MAKRGTGLTRRLPPGDHHVAQHEVGCATRNKHGGRRHAEGRHHRSGHRRLRAGRRAHRARAGPTSPCWTRGRCSRPAAPRPTPRVWSSRPTRRRRWPTSPATRSRSMIEIGCFRQVGGLEVATTPERLAELHRRHGWATAWGIEARVIDPRECAALHPLIDADRVLGGLHVPSDGAALAVAAGETQARAAQARGAVFLGGHEVLDIRRAATAAGAGSPASSPPRASSPPTSWSAAPASGDRRSPGWPGWPCR